jgi:UDP-glucose 4-epimerase
MTILVTGGTGVLGAHVVRRLVQRQQDVVAVSSRGEPALLGELRGSVPIERCDVRDGAGLEQLLERHRVAIVVHLAALMPAVCRERPAEAVDVNVTATAGLYAAAARAGVRRFVYASSKSAYGPELAAEHGPPEYRPISEDTPARPVWMYDVTKRAGELVIEAQRRLGGPETTSLRFATIYGPGKGNRYGGASALSSLIETAIEGGEFTLARGGDQVDDVIWVGDAAEGVVRAALHEGPLRPVYNISTGVGVAIREFAQQVAASYPQARIAVGPGLHYMGDEPTYGVLDPSRAREDFGLEIDADPARGVRLFARALAELQRA